MLLVPILSLISDSFSCFSLLFSTVPTSDQITIDKTVAFMLLIMDDQVTASIFATLNISSIFTLILVMLFSGWHYFFLGFPISINILQSLLESFQNRASNRSLGIP